MPRLPQRVFATALALLALPAHAACRDTVVLVHGDTGSPADFDDTHDEQRRLGWAAGEIYRPRPCGRACPACDDSAGSEEGTVREAPATRWRWPVPARST
jgi:hypothetical protein